MNVIKYFIEEKNININYSDNNGKTVFNLAAQYGSPNAVVKTKHYAAATGKNDTIHYLVKECGF